ncbi:MAG: Succinate dehydrogenase flavin-adding protein, antitoxin of CptAB toxin-antitoxin [uncultured Caballeronia sp.]|nr:MAG: Succinate dehydrogenase flavin-adding protein, antitoxin of CptAB toxin-antitoxin [uncultured Caballeronia sp.]
MDDVMVDHQNDESHQSALLRRARLRWRARRGLLENDRFSADMSTISVTPTWPH